MTGSSSQTLERTESGFLDSLPNSRRTAFQSLFSSSCFRSLPPGGKVCWLTSRSPSFLCLRFLSDLDLCPFLLSVRPWGVSSSGGRCPSVFSPAGPPLKDRPPRPAPTCLRSRSEWALEIERPTSCPLLWPSREPWLSDWLRLLPLAGWLRASKSRVTMRVRSSLWVLTFILPPRCGVSICRRYWTPTAGVLSSSSMCAPVEPKATSDFIFNSSLAARRPGCLWLYPIRAICPDFCGWTGASRKGDLSDSLVVSSLKLTGTPDPKGPRSPFFAGFLASCPATPPPWKRLSFSSEDSARLDAGEDELGSLSLALLGFFFCGCVDSEVPSTLCAAFFFFFLTSVKSLSFFFFFFPLLFFSSGEGDLSLPSRWSRCFLLVLPETPFALCFFFSFFELFLRTFLFQELELSLQCLDPAKGVWVRLCFWTICILLCLLLWLNPRQGYCVCSVRFAWLELLMEALYILHRWALEGPIRDLGSPFLVADDPELFQVDQLRTSLDKRAVMAISLTWVIESFGLERLATSIRHPPSVMGVRCRDVLCIEEVPCAGSLLMVQDPQQHSSLCLAPIVSDGSLNHLALLETVFVPGGPINSTPQPHTGGVNGLFQAEPLGDWGHQWLPWSVKAAGLNKGISSLFTTPSIALWATFSITRYNIYMLYNCPIVFLLFQCNAFLPVWLDAPPT